MDRVFLVLCYWKSSHKFQRWVYKDELILESIYRVLLGLFIVYIILFVNW